MYPSDKRRYPRKNLEMPVTYSVSVLEFREMKKIHRTAMTIDVSEKGLGLITDYPLEKGHVLIVSNGDSPYFPKIAIVRWTMPFQTPIKLD